MAVTSPFIYTITNTSYDLRKISSYIVDPNNSSNVIVRFIDDPLAPVTLAKVAFESAYQAALNASSSFGAGFADPSFVNPNGVFLPSATGPMGTIGNAVSTVVVVPTGTLATASLIAPSLPPNGFSLTIIFAVNTVTAFTLNPNTSQTVLAGSAIAGTASTSAEWRFTTAAAGGIAANSWVRVR